MKSKSTIYTALVGIGLLLGAAIALSQSGGSASDDIKLLTIQVSPDKESYLPGEIITLNFKVLNNSTGPVSIPRNVSVLSGHLQVFIGDVNNRYNMYVGPRWGLADVMVKKGATLQPGGTFETSATILHNQKVETAHLNETAAAEIAKGRIPTDYALPEPGIYFIKAVLLDDDMLNRVESEPVRIIIEEPQGFDLEVWNKIKGDGNFARFMQTGELVERPDGPKTKQVVNTLNQIERSYPTTRYTDRIRAGLAKRRALLEKLGK